ncbi:hypothetical protein [Candidatus Chlamydia sanziniae]|uniref:Myosin heavy chain n=1 Tax=Candidatus Chlamydia sanziniae TaxID=1806891 RepID=A0A1A9HWA9_9CHLA|nr:hypothetical protein [Candidatus Chlamydia sanziniae]ANH78711.1 hypothetical protein Cs308_0541 [Candidatus Chlamydia sanziniae]
MDTSDNSFHTLETEKDSTAVFSSESKMAGEGVQSLETSDELLSAFITELAEHSSLEDQVSFTLKKMEEALKCNLEPNLKLFWAVRKHCLPLFHQIENTVKRADAWRWYIELTKEGRHLKALQDQEGSFIIGQIELAISCLEQDIAAFLQHQNADIAAFQEEDHGFLETQALETHREFYKEYHIALLWLSSFAAKIIDLRKELMSVGMRMRLKSKFFQRLSILGNHVFPQRKDFIDKVSKTFTDDVDAFVAKHFEKACKETLKRSVFFLRKEIKNLQHAAKRLFVSSSVFADTRLKLSRCWDQLKGMEKQIRQEQGRLRTASGENAKEIRQLLANAATLLTEEHDLATVRKTLDGIVKRIRNLDLIHGDVIALKNELQLLFDQLREKQEIAEQNYQENLAKDKKTKQEAIRTLSARIGAFSQACTEGKIGKESRAEWQELKEALTKMSFLPLSEKITLDNQLSLTFQTIIDFFEAQLLSSPDSRERLANMRQVLTQRQERRRELKNKLAHDKKLLGSSGLDFDRAMQYSALVEEDKRALEELDESILNLKRQIQQFT